MDINGIMDVLLDNLHKELIADGTAENLCAVSLFPGDSIPLDYGGCGGIVWVRLTSAHPSAAFPASDVTLDNCAYTLAFPVEVGVYRPAPTVQMIAGKAYPPSDKQNTDAAHLLTNDMKAMHRALVKLKDELELVVLGSFTPQGPYGDLVGGTWTVSVGEY
jgi:hypothetical protein